MRNHNEKARDMARSVLPSTARKSVRERRAQIHGRERARLRSELHALRSIGYDSDGFEGDLDWIAKRDIHEMVSDRREADKVGPLINWAVRLVERDPMLAAATWNDRAAYLGKLLPPGLIGDHALLHLRWVLGDRRRYWWIGASRSGAYTGPSSVEMVQAIVAAGRHGELNRRIRLAVPAVIVRSVRLPAERIIDDENPAPGRLVPARWVDERRRRSVRFLAGSHDIEAFVKDSGRDVIAIIKALHGELDA